VQAFEHAASPLKFFLGLPLCGRLHRNLTSEETIGQGPQLLMRDAALHLAATLFLNEL
jgi:hypothetical protein